MTTKLRGWLAGTLPLALALGVSACASAPQTYEQQRAMDWQGRDTIEQMVARDPTLRDVLDRAYGYVVLPRVHEAASGVGGTRGTGVAFERGEPIGYVTLTRLSTGAQLGAQRYAQLIVFQTHAAFERLESGTPDLTAQATATALGSGSARQASFRNGMAVFVMPERGAMAGVALAASG